ncbi:Probable WRKY transcription factor 50 [Linum grandiflorum]
MSSNFNNNTSSTDHDQYYYGDSSSGTLELSELLSLNEWVEEESEGDPAAVNWFTAAGSGPSTRTVDNSNNNIPAYRPSAAIDGSSTAATGENIGTKERVSFKTKSEVEVLDDGYRWRKYGKKMVKNSPNPRNYYRCSSEGCPVKKRVERDRDDPAYVITTYDGLHTHHF